jgi:hypothetical protein
MLQWGDIVWNCRGLERRDGTLRGAPA